uniref:Uncharacterized protein n=1 Tax=Siphoviridae sp. ctg2r17 TaxID=2825601 RepID=A0A8S5P2M5_9CAUD|nr:MAG TPA: hypothetical protein [Siphoviridae sp. ctg2r17]
MFASPVAFYSGFPQVQQKISDFFHKMHAKRLHYVCNFAIIKTAKRGTLTTRGYNNETNHNKSFYRK